LLAVDVVVDGDGDETRAARVFAVARGAFVRLSSASSMDTATAILQLIIGDILLSGDNAVVNALACRHLPRHQMKKAMVVGTVFAIGLRVLFTFFVDTLFGIPGLKIVGGLLLFWIAIKLLREDDEDEQTMKGGHTLWSAVRIIVIADAVMSLDNVVFITAAAGGRMELVIFGLLLTMPLILFSSAIVMKVIERYPLVVLLGATLLGWIAGDIIIGDVFLKDHIGAEMDWLKYVARAAGATVVFGLGLYWRRQRHEPDTELPESLAPPENDNGGTPTA